VICIIHHITPRAPTQERLIAILYRFTTTAARRACNNNITIIIYDLYTPEPFTHTCIIIVCTCYVYDWYYKLRSYNTTKNVPHTICVFVRDLSAGLHYGCRYTARVLHVVALYTYRQVCVCVCVCACVICKHTWRRTSREIRRETYAKMRAFDSELPPQWCMTIIIIPNNIIISDCLYRQAAPAGTKIHNIPTYAQVLSSFCFVCFFFHGEILWIETVTHADAWTIATRWCRRFAIFLRVRPKT